MYYNCRRNDLDGLAWKNHEKHQLQLSHIRQDLKRIPYDLLNQSSISNMHWFGSREIPLKLLLISTKPCFVSRINSSGLVKVDLDYFRKRHHRLIKFTHSPTLRALFTVVHDRVIGEVRMTQLGWIKAVRCSEEETDQFLSSGCSFEAIVTWWQGPRLAKSKKFFS
jgi:hypothetical protein